MALPTPEAGLVISYAYLWSNEYKQGKLEGLKNRPCAIILVVQNEEGGKKVTVAPITHTPPSNPDAAIEIPIKVKNHLGLDSERSWIILNDFNEFLWPGYDLRPIAAMDNKVDYGVLPPLFYTQIVSKILELRQKAKSVTPRD
ncbi:growth inhibitor PemK [Methylotuvimicrobium sp. KM1]|uniref:growth inhibitor PemK n=1 Tax=Methylotuvimicrobium sp. KM1 TaxID=3377707 RepID=UPI00384FBAB2